MPTHILQCPALNVFAETNGGLATRLFIQGDTTHDAQPVSSIGFPDVTHLFDDAANWGELGTGTFTFPALGVESIAHQDGTPSFNILWKQLDFSFSPNTFVLSISHFRLTSELLPNISIEGDLRFVFVDKVFQAARSSITLYQTVAANPVTLPMVNLDWESGPLVFSWVDPNLNYWLEQLMPGFIDIGEPAPVTPTLSISHANGIPEEIEFEWGLPGSSRSYVLPGLRAMDIQAASSLRIRLGEGTEDLNMTRFYALHTPGNPQATAKSAYAWIRTPDREILNDIVLAEKAPPLIELQASGSTITTPGGSENRLLLMQYNPLLTDPPLFLQERSTDPTVNLIIPNGTSNGFTYPFLFNDVIEHKQSMYVNGFTPKTSTDPSNVRLDTAIEVVSGNLELTSLFIEESLFIDKVAFTDRHNAGREIYSTSSAQITQQHMGMDWRFIPDASNRNQLFTLITKDYGYQIKQAEGARIELDFKKASEEPITFIVEDFVLTEKGITLTANVLDKPVRLNGVDTKFKFENSQFTIVENQIADFSIAGSGPLPPDLVGEAIANISLQFKQLPGGEVTLVAGNAELDKIDLLKAPLTRFEYVIDAIELLFIETLDVAQNGKLFTEVSNDLRGQPGVVVINNTFHLYFNLSGTAQYRPNITDNPAFPLNQLKVALITLESVPLAGNARVLRNYIDFLITLPEPVGFDIMGVFQMEIRAFGFLPRTKPAKLLPPIVDVELPQGVNDSLVPVAVHRPNAFGDDPAMILSGQVFFSNNGGDSSDTVSTKIDFHGLYIGLPRDGSASSLPRLHFKDLAVEIKFKETFHMTCTLSMIDDLNETGFSGEGTITVKDYTFAAAFAFLRVRENELSDFKRAWFIFLELRGFSVHIPYINIFLREIGVGFGYRFTLASIKTADQENDIAKLLGELRKLSRTAGDLAKRDRWSVDLEKEGEDPRWTIVLRALFSQTSMVKSKSGSPNKKPAAANRSRAVSKNKKTTYAKDREAEKAGKSKDDKEKKAIRNGGRPGSPRATRTERTLPLYLHFRRHHCRT